jgi:hypothetical protein
MTDQEFIDGFFSGKLLNGEFHHRDHLRLTWLVLSRHGRERGSRMLAHGISHFAAAHGQASRYHETMTRFWIWLVDHVRTSQPQLDSFEEFLTAFPAALDKNLPFRHWTKEVMMSPSARSTWVEPDMVPLP